MHLSPQELVDLAEGTRPERLVPHVQSCERCRQELATLRDVMLATASAEVPEPSPLFWEHLSERVRTGISTEEPGGVPERRAAWFWPAGAIAGVAVAVALVFYVTAPGGSQPESVDGGINTSVSSPSPSIDGTMLDSTGVDDDASLALVADLTGQLDPDAVAEIGWSTRPGVIDGMVTGLNGDERIELQRLLKEALAKPGA